MGKIISIVICFVIVQWLAGCHASEVSQVKAIGGEALGRSDNKHIGSYVMLKSMSSPNFPLRCGGTMVDIKDIQAYQPADTNLIKDFAVFTSVECLKKFAYNDSEFTTERALRDIRVALANSTFKNGQLRVNFRGSHPVAKAYIEKESLGKSRVAVLYFGNRQAKRIKNPKRVKVRTSDKVGGVLRAYMRGRTTNFNHTGRKQYPVTKLELEAASGCESVGSGEFCLKSTTPGTGFCTVGETTESRTADLGGPIFWIHGDETYLSGIVHHNECVGSGTHSKLVQAISGGGHSVSPVVRSFDPLNTDFHDHLFQCRIQILDQTPLNLEGESHEDVTIEFKWKIDELLTQSLDLPTRKEVLKTCTHNGTTMTLYRSKDGRFFWTMPDPEMGSSKVKGLEVFSPQRTIRIHSMKSLDFSHPLRLNLVKGRSINSLTAEFLGGTEIPLVKIKTIPQDAILEQKVEFIDPATGRVFKASNFTLGSTEYLSFRSRNNRVARFVVGEEVVEEFIKLIAIQNDEEDQVIRTLRVENLTDDTTLYNLQVRCGKSLRETVQRIEVGDFHSISINEAQLDRMVQMQGGCTVNGKSIDMEFDLPE